MQICRDLKKGTFIKIVISIIKIEYSYFNNWIVAFDLEPCQISIMVCFPTMVKVSFILNI